MASGSRTDYCYDLSKAGHVLAEYEEDSLNQYYVYGPGIDDPICLIKPNGDVYYYHVDGLGSVIALSDDLGEVAEEYAYDVFGTVEIRNTNNEILNTSSVGNSYMFSGRRIDSESGLYYYRARMYSPDIGRFLQTDPIGYKDGINWYAYVRNNPIMLKDPLGLTSYEDCFTDCMETLLLGIPGVPATICTSGFSFAALIADALKAKKIAGFFGIVPAWAIGAAVGCATGCGLVEDPDGPGIGPPVLPPPGSPGRMY